MRILMISLDNRILDPLSPVAGRMVAYGKRDVLHIIIPAQKAQKRDVSDSVHVCATGGRMKWTQLMRIVRIGKRLCREQGIDKITAQDPFFIALAGLFLKRRFKIPLEVQAHGDFFGPFGASWHRRCIARVTLRRADSVRVVGERVRKSMLALGVPENHIVTRPVPVDAAAILAYTPKTHLHENYPEYEKIFLTLGRLDPVKNIPWLVQVFAEAVKKHPQWGLVIVGQGTERDSIARLIDALGLSSSVRLVAWTNDPWRYVKTADCVLFPSISEGYGLVPMEAHAAGTPVIMTNVGVANHELPPGPKVMIVPVNDRHAFLRALFSFSPSV